MSGGGGEARLWTTVAAVLGAVVVAASVSDQMRAWANWFGWALVIAAVLWLPGWVLLELVRQRREVRERVDRAQDGEVRGYDHRR